MLLHRSSSMLRHAAKARPSPAKTHGRTCLLKRVAIVSLNSSNDRVILEEIAQRTDSRNNAQKASASEWLNLVQSEVATLERELANALARNSELEQALNKQASAHQRELQEAREAAEKIRAQMRDSNVVSAADWKGYVKAEEAQVNVLEKELVLVTARNTELDIARDIKVKSLKQELMEAKMEAQLIQKQIREEKVASAADWLTFVQTSSEADQKQINALEEQLALAQTSSNELQSALEQQAASLKMQLLEAKEASDEFKKQMRQEKIATSAEWLTYVQSAAEADQKQIDTLEKELQLALACNSDLELASNEKAMALQAAFEEAKMEAADLRKQMRQDKISSAADWLTYVQDTSAADQKQINALEEQLSLAVSSNQEMDQAMKEQAAALQMEVKEAKMEAEQVKLQMRQDKIASAADWLSYVQDTSAADQKQINALEEQLSQTVARHEQLEQAVAVQTATLQQDLKAAKLDAQRIKSEMREALIVSGAEWLTYVQAEQKQILLLEEQMQMAEARHVDMQQALDDQTAAHQLALQEAKAVADSVKAQARAEKISTAAEWLTYVQSEQAQILTLEEELQAAAAQTRQMEETLALQSEAHAQDLKQAALAQQALKKQMRDEKVAAAADWLTYAQEASEADMAKIAALEAELAVALAQVEELEKATSEERSALQQEVKNAKADAERIKLEMRQAKITSAADWLTYVQEVSEADAQKISALEAELEAANARVAEVEALAAQETVELESRLKEALATAERIKLEMRAAKVASAAEWLDFVQQSSETDQARIAELEAELQQARQELMEVKTDSDSIRESTLSSAAELLTSVQAVQNRVGSLESELQMALARNAELEQQYDATSSQTGSFYSYNSYTPEEPSVSEEEPQSEDEQEREIVYDYANTTDFFGSAEPAAEEEVPVNNQFDAFLDAPSFW